ncbi:MAG: ABC transporter ATP-binding protein [Chloroflexi bacterium]|nr:ABC transporter ATP-binding protein [Chloroflexota bacterium]
MADLAVRAEGLSKSYRIDHQGKAGARTLRETLVSLAQRPLQRRPSDRSSHETIWALKDVSFDVNRGEVLGIVGRNGSGKSTLLKILSRITTPTSGRAEVVGRLGSLLEVGTGFHPELTGRENIFLNGSILGMKRDEIKARFDEIVAFAETEQFLDTPVKRYSTGMYLRLAFAVAAHLETEVLIVDEVLAVGDAAFQQKCLGKMSDVAGQGRTVLFVSHNMGAVSQLCSKAILMEHGIAKAYGTVDEIIGRYSGKATELGRVELANRDSAAGTGDAKFQWADVRNADDASQQDFSMGETVRIAFGLRLASHLPKTRLVIAIRRSDGTPISLISDDDSSFALPNDHEQVSISADLTDIRLYPGTYSVSLWATDNTNTEEFDRVDDILVFRIVDGGKLTMRSLPRHAGFVFLTPTWRSRPILSEDSGIRTRQLSGRP